MCSSIFILQMVRKNPSLCETGLPFSQLESLPPHKLAGCTGELHFKFQSTNSLQLHWIRASSWKFHQHGFFFISILRIWMYFYVEFKFTHEDDIWLDIMKNPSVLQTWLPRSQLETLPLHNIAGCQGKLHWKLQTTDSHQLNEFGASSWKIHQQRRYRFIIFCGHECLSMWSSILHIRMFDQMISEFTTCFLF